jgi:hypothetical protein
VKQVVRNYTFNATTRVITLTDFAAVSLDRLALVVNTTTNKILWNLADATVATATVSTNTVTLSVLPGGDTNSDKLAIFYDAQPTDGAVFVDGQTPTSSAFLSVPFTTTTVQAVATTDAGLYSWVSVHLSSSGTSSTATFQASNDNVNWTNAPLLQTTSTNGVVVNNATSAFMFHGPLPGRYFRLNVTGISAGTTAGVVTFFANAHMLPTAGVTAAQTGTWTVQPGNTPNSTAWLMSRAASATGGHSFTNIATNTTTVVKGSAATLRSVTVNTKGTGTSTVTIYDHASTATGTKVATIDSATFMGSAMFDVACANGIVVVTTGTAAPDVTVSYK